MSGTLAVALRVVRVMLTIRITFIATVLVVALSALCARASSIRA